jgi:hypothetical protein
LKHLYKPNAEFSICGDINTDYLIESSQKNLAPLLTTHNLSHPVNFATRIQNNTSTAIYNTFLDNSIINLSSISPTINGLSDHDAQILAIRNMCATINIFPSKKRTRLRDKQKVMNFQNLF